MGFVVGNGVGATPAGTTGQYNMVLDQDTILQDREGGLTRHSVAIEQGPMKDNVIALPLTRFGTDIDKGDRAPVEGGALTVGIGRIVVGVQDLNLVGVLQEDAAVASALAPALHLGGGLRIQDAVDRIQNAAWS